MTGLIWGHTPRQWNALFSRVARAERREKIAELAEAFRETVTEVDFSIEGLLAPGGLLM